MESVKKWLLERTSKRNGIYVHYSPPKAVGVVSGAQLRQWARGGTESRLERAVINGQGRRLLAEAEALHLSPHLPALVAKCEALHAAVERGSLVELQVSMELLDSEYHRKKFVMCRDVSGTGLLHKAIYYDFMDIAEWLVMHYPMLVHQRDAEGRTPLHYTSQCRDEAGAAALLEGAGASRGARDAAGHTPAHYRGSAGTTLALPQHNMSKEAAKHPPGLVIKRHNIRIWFHDCDMARLQRVVWEGHGAKLLSEVSNQPVVKRFLEALPYIMNTIRDIHVSVIQNDLEAVMKHSGDPVPPQILSSRDANYMTVMHKAAGLGHGGILKYVAQRYPEGVNDVDNDGRTPLHYAAAVRDDQHTYHTLVSLGADEGATDNKNKTPGYYVNRPQDIDKNIFKSLPEAPRTPSSAYPLSWDWKLLDTEVIAELNKKSRRKNFKASSENISSKNNTVSENFKSERSMKNSNTHDLIKDLPELDDNGTTENGISFEDINNKESELADNEHETEEVSLTDNHNEENQEEVEETNGIESNDETKIEEDNPTKDEIEKIVEQNEELTKHEDRSEEEEDNNDNDINDCETTEQNIEEKNENEDIEDNKGIEKNNEQENEIKEVNQNSDETQQNDSNDIEINDDNDSMNELEKDKDNEKEKEENENKKEQEENTPKQEERNKPEEEREEHNPKEEKENEEEQSATIEGNENKQFVEDDDDVQVQGDTPSEYSDINLRSTAEVSDTEITKRGNLITGRNTQESLIEGIVNGEMEQDSQDASIGQTDESIKGEMLVVDSQIDPEVTDLINSANMEMLAALVLNGEGSRLVGRHSRNPELQAFLDNVPSYMQKIKKVHIAAKEGNIRDLQAALDRRKFAIARDLISPNGATPLHVATIYGKTNIMKYLGGRFPETLSAVDFEGRTALHYSAVLPDNGHYYNLLQQLGANSKDLDDSGRSAENFLKNPTLLPYDQLLADFNISEEVAKNILSDKIPEDSVSSRRSLEAPEVLETLERCYRLLASARPARTPLSASSNKATPPLVLGRFLKRSIFEIVKHRVTKLDHDLFDVIWPAVKKLPENRNILQTVEEDFPGGVAAPDYYVYEVFHEFLTPLIKDLHNINVNSDLQLHPPSDFVRKKILTTSSSTSSELLVELNIDPRDEFVLSGTLECSRNLNNFELPLNLKIGQLEMIERVVTTLLLQDEFKNLSEQSNPESDQKGGNYYTLNEVLEKPSEICASLASAGLLIALCDKEEIDDYSRLHGKHWPYGRGVFVNDDNSVAVWVNVHDHIRVLVCTPTETPGEIGQAFSKMSHIMTYLHEKLDFAWDFKFGHLSSRPTFLGSGIRFSMIINFPGLSKDSDNMKQLCAMRGLQYRETLSPGIARISNYQCLGISEANCFEDFTAATSNLLQLEKESSMQNSTHIATMLTNIFRRKKNSLANTEDSDTNENRSSQVANDHMDIPVFQTDEGRYLANSLGDPLIKGLTEVANVKPKDPVAFLASFLHNFPENEKPQLGTEKTEMIITQEAAEVENEQPAPPPAAMSVPLATNIKRDSRTAVRPHRPIDVITVDSNAPPEPSPDAPEVAFSSANRDEHGQSMLHFAAARQHTRNALFQLLQDSDISLAYRDELYRTARDVSIQANIHENTVEIDRWVLHLTARGNKEKIMELLMEGYNHILDIVDDDGVPITEIVAQRGEEEMTSLLASVPVFEESRETLHSAIRRGDLETVKSLLSADGGRTLAKGKNAFGRTTLHVAVLAQHEDTVSYLAETYPELLRIGDNLERTPLHYAMGVEKMESLSRVLIRAGAKRVLKDLKGRQPSYYFMNKSDILRLKEEEEVY